MRKTDYSIPNEFIELDNRVTDIDAFINIRDLQTCHANHNILLARRARSQFVSQCFVQSDGTPLALKSIEPVTVDKGRGQLAFSCKLFANEYCKNIKVIIWASRASVTGTPDSLLYATLDSAQNKSELDSTQVITIDSTTPQAYPITIPVHRELVNSFLVFSLYFTTPMSSAVKEGFSALALTDVHNVKGEVVANFPSSPKGLAIAMSNAGIPPKIARKYDGAGSGTKWTGMERDWEGPTPIPGTDTVSAYDVAVIFLYSIGIYPIECTDFFQTTGA